MGAGKHSGRLDPSQDGAKHSEWRYAGKSHEHIVGEQSSARVSLSVSGAIEVYPTTTLRREILPNGPEHLLCLSVTVPNPKV